MLEPVKAKINVLEQIKLIFRVITAKSFDLGDISYRIILFVHAAAIFGKISNIKWYPLLLIFIKSSLGGLSVYLRVIFFGTPYTGVMYGIR